MIEQFFAKVFTGQEIAYSMRIGGALLALLTPDPGFYGLPHYRFFQTFTSRGLFVTSAIYVTIVEGFRLTWKSFGRIFVGMNIYLVIVFLVNQAIGSNYMLVAHKPETARLALDILRLEVISLPICTIIYIPFIMKDWMMKAQPA